MIWFLKQQSSLGIGLQTPVSENQPILTGIHVSFNGNQYFWCTSCATRAYCSVPFVRPVPDLYGLDLYYVNLTLTSDGGDTSVLKWPEIFLTMTNFPIFQILRSPFTFVESCLGTFLEIKVIFYRKYVFFSTKVIFYENFFAFEFVLFFNMS